MKQKLEIGSVRVMASGHHVLIIGADADGVWRGYDVDDDVLCEVNPADMSLELMVDDGRADEVRQAYMDKFWRPVALPMPTVWNRYKPKVLQIAAKHDVREAASAYRLAGQTDERVTTRYIRSLEQFYLLTLMTPQKSLYRKSSAGEGA